MNGTASWLELVWTLSGCVGLIVCAWALNLALAAMRWSEAAGWLEIDRDDLDALDDQEARDVIARGAVVDESLRCAAQLLTIVAGLAAMTLPSSSVVHAEPARAVVVGCIVGVQLAMVTKSILGTRRRVRVIAILSRRRDRRRGA